MSAPPLVQGLEALERGAQALVAGEVRDLAGPMLGEVLERMEAVEAQLAAVRAEVVAAIEADGTWATSGARSLSGWLRQRTGRPAREAGRMVREARALRDHLPATRAALAAGDIGPDHAAVLARHATASARCVAMLADPQVGEEFLVDQARALDADRLSTLVRHWAVRADPEAADRGWEADSGREEFSLARTTGGYHGRVWLSEANGQLLATALAAQGGRRAVGDERTPAQRRAAALVELAGAALDSGRLTPGARIRPHLAITTTLTTLLALLEAQKPADGPGREPTTQDRSGSAAGGGGAAGEGGAVPELTIDTRLDPEVLAGVEAASLEDGTPIPFGLLAQLACESRLHRVIFGPDSEILDVGREERLFTAGQTRGIIARDQHCQFPDCTAPPGQGEIHHSLWWYAHGGATDAAKGILLCRYHHSFVHQRGLLIERYANRWRFVRPNGTTFGETWFECA